jgi:hypothetical protein
LSFDNYESVRKPDPKVRQRPLGNQKEINLRVSLETIAEIIEHSDVFKETLLTGRNHRDRCGRGEIPGRRFDKWVGSPVAVEQILNIKIGKWFRGVECKKSDERD